jgi:hypothetical protein
MQTLAIEAIITKNVAVSHILFLTFNSAKLIDI